MRSKLGNGLGMGSVALIALGAFVAASGCDHVHWLGIFDDGGSPTDDGAVTPSDAGPFDVGADVGPANDGAVEAGGDGGLAAVCQRACSGIMECGLGGYGPYRAGVGYAYAYVIGPYGYATGYASIGSYGYGAYGFRDLEYQQCVSSCETYSDCLGCGPASERDRIVNCVIENTCPALLDCLAR